MICAASLGSDLLRALLQGAPPGTVYALVALGFVLAFKTSGVFNLAFGAQAYVSAAMFFHARVAWGWSTVPAFVLAVLLLAPLTGLVLERLIFRHLRTGSSVAKLVVAIGLSVALPNLFDLVVGFEPVAGRTPEGIAPRGASVFYDPLGVYAFSRDDGVPGSGWLKKVSQRYRTPANSVVAITVASWLLIALIYVLTKALGGDPFFIIAGVTGVSTVLLYWAYGVCIALGLWGDQSWRADRSWSLGRWSRPIAMVAVVWILLISPLFLYPFPLNPAALATVAGFLLLLLVYYVVWARSRFQGPKRQGTDAELTDIEREFERAAGEVASS